MRSEAFSTGNKGIYRERGYVSVFSAGFQYSTIIRKGV